MKANELRIGNLVNLRNWQEEIGFFSEFDISQKQFDRLIEKGEGYATVLSINKDEIELEAYGCNLDFYNYSEIEPITITEEWLINIGFNKFPNQKKYDTDEFWACQLRNGNEWHFEDLECIVKYVHELQNLFFALTGTELELKNELI